MANSMVWFVEPNILHMGDLFFNGIFPVIDLGSGGSMRGYLTVMKETYAKIDDKTVLIPGHGEIATKADLAKQIAMLEEAIAAVDKHVKRGDSLENAGSAPAEAMGKICVDLHSRKASPRTLYNGLKK